MKVKRLKVKVKSEGRPTESELGDCIVYTHSYTHEKHHTNMLSS